MALKNLTNLSNPELGIEQKQLKKLYIVSGVMAAVITGVSIFNSISEKIDIQSFTPIIFIIHLYFLKTKRNAVDNEIKSRSKKSI